MPDSDSGWSEREENRTQLRRFVVIGVLSVLTDFAFYLLLTSRGLNTATAKGISYLAGMAVGFVGNKCWTFRSKRRSGGEVLTYLALYALTLVLNIGVNELGRATLTPLAPLQWVKPLAFLAATGVTTIVNFLGMRFITFRLGIDQRRRAAQRSDRGEITPTTQDPA